MWIGFIVFIGRLDNIFGRQTMMKKAKLIKKNSPLQEQIKQARKSRRARAKKKTAARTAIEVTTDWLKQRSEETPSARESFAALFTKSDPQSA
jgi:hypothetical protein